MSERAVATWHYTFSSPDAGARPLCNGRFASQASRVFHLLQGFAVIESVTVDRTGRAGSYRCLGASPGLLGYLRCHDDVAAVHADLGLRALRGPFEELLVSDGARLTVAPIAGGEADGTITLELFDDLHLGELNGPLLSGFLARLSRRMPAALRWTSSDEHIADARGLIEGLPLAAGQ